MEETGAVDNFVKQLDMERKQSLICQLPSFQKSFTKSSRLAEWVFLPTENHRQSQPIY